MEAVFPKRPPDGVAVLPAPLPNIPPADVVAGVVEAALLPKGFCPPVAGGVEAVGVAPNSPPEGLAGLALLC